MNVQLDGYTRFYCFLSLSDSRAKQDNYKRKNGIPRDKYCLDQMNVKNTY